MESNFITAQSEILAFISTTKNQKLINAKIKELLNEAFSTFETILEEDIENITALTYNATGAIMATYVSNDLASSFKKWEKLENKVQSKILDNNRLLFGSTWAEHKQKALLNASMGLKGAIIKGFSDGVGIEQISRDVKTQFGKLNRNNIKSIVRTSMFQAINEAKSESFDFFEKEITEYYYNSVTDSRTTFRCWGLNNKSSKNKSDIIKLLDFHWNCRATLGVRTELSDEFDKLDPDRRIVEWNKKTVNHRDNTKSTKFSVDAVKKIPNDASAETAFKVFSDAYQKDFLGEGRYNLWKSGKAKFDDMFSISRSTPIPLNELKKKLGIN